jgi:C-terminal processing protease CtpA/Prc
MLPRIELAEEGVVSGVVVDGTGQPVVGARVARDSVPTYLPSSGVPAGMAVTDSKGRFRLGELAEGLVVLEAYAPDVGRVRVEAVHVVSGRTNDSVRLTLVRGQDSASEPLTTGGVAVTLGETAASGTAAPEVVIVSVAEGSEAERAGLMPNDILVDVGGQHVQTMVEARSRLSGPEHVDLLVVVRRSGLRVPVRVSRERVRR